MGSIELQGHVWARLSYPIRVVFHIDTLRSKVVSQAVRLTGGCRELRLDTHLGFNLGPFLYGLITLALFLFVKRVGLIGPPFFITLGPFMLLSPAQPITFSILSFVATCGK
ncbi:hypothetical protein CRG98_026937 [Punica granatum]|uniref:Uncharacterized protein n=1 Tax=Punica granatum TaxID=22663 RepID=A0A2I0J8W2_PUNGR|nr:hypothetical protein CRG98_026937 [Punica granatum]